MNLERDDARTFALDGAIRLHHERFHKVANCAGLLTAHEQVMATADALYAWVPAVASLAIVIGPVSEQESGDIVGEPEGEEVAVALTSSQMVELTADPEDKKGFDVEVVDIVWTVEGPTDVVTLEVSEDTKTCVVKAANALGSVAVKASVGDLFGSVAVDVVAGALDHIDVEEGTPEEQPATPL